MRNIGVKLVIILLCILLLYGKMGVNERQIIVFKVVYKEDCYV